MQAEIGKKTPNIIVSKWVQGIPIDITKGDDVKVIEVFQVNCPGCFMYGIPEVIQVYEKYKNDGITVAGVATAFEDFTKNTLENLKLLLTSGKVIGDTLEMLGQNNYLDKDNHLPYKIPFPVGMDELNPPPTANENNAKAFILQQIPNFETQPQEYKNQIMQQAMNYLQSKQYSPATFDKFALRGTPSVIIIDRNSILRHVEFGQHDKLESMVSALLNE